MRIVIVTAIFPRSEEDPRGSFVLDQARALSERGHHLEVVVLERAGTAPRPELLRLMHVGSVTYVPAPLRFGATAWSLSLRAQSRALRSLLSRGFDVAVVHDELVAVAAQPRLKELDIPWVLVVHGANRNPALDRPSGIRMRNDVYGRASAIVTVGDGVALPLWTVAKEHRIPNGAGVPGTVGEAPERTAAVMAVSVSGLRAGKGIEDNLAALGRLAADAVDLGYWVAGDGPLRDDLEALARELGLSDRVRFLGPVRRDRLGAVLAGADFFALPSSPEAFGIAYVEAMQTGLPVIACKGEGPAGFVTDGEDGFLVAHGDVEELERVWRMLATDAQRRTRMGDRARKAAAPLTWALNAERIEALLAEVVAEHTPPQPGRDLWWLGVEPTAYMLDSVAAVRKVIPDTNVAFLEGGADISTARLLAGVIRRRPRVLLVEGWGHPKLLAAMAAAIVARIPFIVGGDTHAAAGGRRGLLRRLVRRAAIRPLVRRAAVLFPGGTPQARYMRELVGDGSQPLEIAHMTVDTEAFARAAVDLTPEDRDRTRRGWGCGADETVVLFVGRLVAEKGLLLLIHAMEELCDTEVRLVVYGVGPLERRIRRASERLPIHYAGAVSKETLATAYPSADVFALPSLFEPWGLVVNEAMASGLPCVVSDAVGSGEDLIEAEETGWIVAPGDARPLAAALRRVASDPKLRRKAGAAARERMRDWSMDTYTASVARAVALATRSA